MMSAPAGLSFFARTDDADLEARELAEQLQRDSVRRRRRWRFGLAGTAALAVIGVLTSTVVSATAAASPSANDWYRLRMCESSNNYQANTGNGHYGAYQFDVSTWRSVGGAGLPSAATPAEQDKRALLLYQSRGWQPWQCAKIIGLVSGGTTQVSTAPASTPPTSTPPVTPAATTPAVTTPPAATVADQQAAAQATAHGYPGRSLTQGESSPTLVAWQQQMRARGATLLTGTGQYGPNTAVVVKALQKQNGLAPLGVLGPQTWQLAWTGTFLPTAATRATAVRVPKWSGTVLRQGVWSSRVATWQKQLHARGATTVTGTGEFGAKTTALVKALQRQNHVPVTGRIDATTWALAWTGSYHR